MSNSYVCIDHMKYLLLYVLLIISYTADSQIFLQLEKANSTKVIKYSSGDQIYFKSIEYPEYWQDGKIYRIIPEEKSVVFGDRITYLKDITSFRYYRRWPQAIGNNLMRFGVSWFAFAGLIEGLSELELIDSPYRFGTDTAIIGASAIASGYLTKKLFTVVTKKMNDRNRLRIIDLRM